MIEEWRVIPGTNDYYEASNLGRIRSWAKPGNPTRVKNRRRTSPHVLSPKYHTIDNRPAVHIRMNGRMRSPHVQTLVALAFLGPRPDGAQVCHNDGDAANNHVGNLRYDTPKGNMADTRRHGTHNAGIRNGSSKLTEADVRAIRSEYARGGIFHREIAERYGVATGTVGDIVRVRIWKHLEGSAVTPHQDNPTPSGEE
jgi:hypothetical protein